MDDIFFLFWIIVIMLFKGKCFDSVAGSFMYSRCSGIWIIIVKYNFDINIMNSKN